MPELSFVVVVHRQQAYLRECIGSLLGQAGAELEVVAIDDASPDHGPALLDELAAADPRLRVIHLPERIGLGPARQVGLDAARGEHVWFVDVTDTLTVGALRAVLERLRRDGPDVLLVDHELVDGLGQRRPGGHGELLATLAGAEPGRLDERPGAAAMAAGLWDKVLRVEHVRRLGVGFGAGGHSELSVTWPALIAAQRVAASPSPGYVRREPANAPAAAIDASDLLAQHDAAWAFLEGRRGRARLEPIVRDALLTQGLAALERLRGDERAAFFAGLAAAHRRRGGAAAAGAPRSVPALRARLVAADRYRAYDVVATSAAQAKAARARTGVAVRRAHGVARRVNDHRLARHYRRALRAPIDPELAVFSAYWGRGYLCNPRAIHERALALLPSLRTVWVVTEEAVDDLPAGLEHVVEETPAYYDVMARAAVLVNNVNFANDVVKRPGTTHVMTHHGTPLKHMGIDVAARGSQRELERLLRRIARWDYSVSANPFTTLIWERVFPGTYETLEVGYPRNDVLARADPAAVAAARVELGIEPGQRTVLVAPTHREYLPGYVPAIDVAALADGLGADTVVLDRRHYLYGDEPRLEHLHDAGRVLDVSDHPAIERLCLAADVLVTDYSSLLFDYAVLDRPIVVHAPDWEVYRTMRGTYFDLLAAPPGVVTRTVAGVVDAIAGGEAAGPEAAALRAAFRARFCALEDGHAAERVVRRVWLGETDAARGAPAPAPALA